MKSFEARLRDRRNKAGLSFEKALIVASAYTPADVDLSISKIRRMEGVLRPVITEDAADPFLVRALALAYECNVSDLSPLAVTRLEERRDLLVLPFSCIAA